MIRVLIADDHPVVRAGVRYLVESAGLTVVAEADSFPGTHQALSEHQIDVLLLDINMPGGGVLSALSQIVEAHPRVRTLILTMHAEDAFAVRVLRAGARGYVTKDRASEELVLAIQQVHAGKRVISPRVAELLLDQLDQGERPPHDSLTPREFEVFKRLVSGERVTDIAATLHLSSKTVSTHKRRLMDKLGIDSTAGLTRYALRHGLLEHGRPGGG